MYTHFNGGDWPHDDLATLLSGKQYVELVPRCQYIGFELAAKWTKLFPLKVFRIVSYICALSFVIFYQFTVCSS